jgi:endoglucanase
MSEHDFHGGAFPLEGFSHGLNITGWFQYVNSARQIQFAKYGKKDFENLKAMGVDVIRLPIEFQTMTLTRAPDYRIDPLLFEYLDQVAAWADELKIYLILDDHSPHGGASSDQVHTPLDIDKVIIPTWSQIAAHYKNASQYVVYEVMNEPYGEITGAQWGAIQGKVINKIREYDTTHWVIVGGHSWNSIDALKDIPKYEDKKLIYTFHFYDPHIFTHQGATWGDPPTLANLRGLPFPYDANNIPQMPKELAGTWMEQNLKDYQRLSSSAVLAAALDKAVRFSKERGVPVFCGEFGAYMKNSQNADRVRWYQTVTQLLDERNIPRTSWDFSGGFGIFKTENGRSFENDLNIEVVEALRFNPPHK